MEDAELAPLVQSIRDLDAATSQARGVQAARAGLLKSLLSLGATLDDGHALRHVADIGRAFDLARRGHLGKVKPGKVTSDEWSEGSFESQPMAFALRLPRDYAAKTNRYPVILAIAGEGESPASHIRNHWTFREAKDQAIVLCPAMPEAPGDWGKVMVNGQPGGISHILTALRIATDRFAVDFDRVYLACHGEGIAAALACGDYSPQRFAGILGSGGDIGEVGPANLSNLPTFFAEGGPKARAYAAAAKAAGHDNCTLVTTAGKSEAWSWVLDHPRRPYPEQVKLVVGQPFPTQIYWLRLAPSAMECDALAILDREANSIRISGKGFSRVTLFLNDALLDLDKPLSVLRGDAAVEVKVERQLGDALHLLSISTADPACLYTAVLEIDTGPEGQLSLTRALPKDPSWLVRRAQVHEQPEPLWELYRWCAESGRAAQGEGVLQRLLRLDPDHMEARTALGHVQHSGAWFPSQSALDDHLAAQEPDVAISRGWSRYKQTWMHPQHKALAAKGHVVDRQTGQWADRKQSKQLAQGWVRQDLIWIAPDDIRRLNKEQWKVDGLWVELAEAERQRARIASMWRIPSPHAALHTTVDRPIARRALEVMDSALIDLRRVFGAEPALPLNVALMRDEDQYDRLAFGDPDGRRAPSHLGRRHVIHSAFFAESWLPFEGGDRVFKGMGVGYWDTASPSGDLYGVHAARLAFGLSYADAVDPSPKAVRSGLRSGAGAAYYESYQSEKVLPLWLHYGGAVYAERFFRDTRVPGGGASEDGDPWWARTWSLDNLKRLGGLRPLAEVFAFGLEPNDRSDGLKLMIEAGLVVAFALDGHCEPVEAAHASLRSALAAGPRDTQTRQCPSPFGDRARSRA